MWGSASRTRYGETAELMEKADLLLCVFFLQTPCLLAVLGGPASASPFTLETVAPPYSNRWVQLKIPQPLRNRLLCLHWALSLVIGVPVSQGPPPGSETPSSWRVFLRYWSFRFTGFPVSFNASSLFPLLPGCWDDSCLLRILPYYIIEISSYRFSYLVNSCLSSFYIFILKSPIWITQRGFCLLPGP